MKLRLLPCSCCKSIGRIFFAVNLLRRQYAGYPYCDQEPRMLLKNNCCKQQQPCRENYRHGCKLAEQIYCRIKAQFFKAWSCVLLLTIPRLRLLQLFLPVLSVGKYRLCILTRSFPKAWGVCSKTLWDCPDAELQRICGSPAPTVWSRLYNAE